MSPSQPDSAQPLRLLHPLSAIALIVGIVVGALISIAGALCYAELCTAYPNAGGDYHFLQRAFGRDLSFMYGWSRATIINTGSIA